MEEMGGPLQWKSCPVTLREGWGKKSVVCPYNIVSVSSLHATRETEPKWEDSVEALKRNYYIQQLLVKCELSLGE